MRCRQAEKDVPVSRHPCFWCIRNNRYADEYEFAWECATDVMIKMSVKELNELAVQVLHAMRDKFGSASDDELILLGDCYARVLFHTMTRGNFLRGSYRKADGIREIVSIAADRSMPAWGLWVSMERDGRTMPKCWLALCKSMSH